MQLISGLFVLTLNFTALRIFHFLDSHNIIIVIIISYFQHVHTHYCTYEISNKVLIERLFMIF